MESSKNETSDITHRILDAFAFDGCDQLFWRTDSEYAPITFFAQCNDLFYWACSDCERITPDNIDLLEHTKADAETATGDPYMWEWPLLFACRSRKMRPQTPYYKHLAEKLKPLFDACGPERKDA